MKCCSQLRGSCRFARHSLFFPQAKLYRVRDTCVEINIENNDKKAKKIFVVYLILRSHKNEESPLCKDRP
jgi:hypothetical protein